jgi:hypothetical protein
LAVLEAPERVHARGARLEGAEGLGQVGGQVLGEPEPHGGGLEQPCETRRPPAQDVGEHLARAAQARQKRHRARMLGQRAEEHGPIDAGRVALEIVERHVRVRRGRELGE